MNKSKTERLTITITKERMKYLDALIQSSNRSKLNIMNILFWSGVEFLETHIKNDLNKTDMALDIIERFQEDDWRFKDMLERTLNNYNNERRSIENE